LERLQKIIAQAGVASRRRAESLITEGRVRVNGQVVTELGAKAHPGRDAIEVDGRRLQVPRAWTYILLYKPTGVVTTAHDELGRRTVFDLVKGIDARLFTVGRLDYDAEGALLLTNDGELAADLTHPSGQVPKTYQVKVRGLPAEEILARLNKGVVLEDGLAQASGVHRVAVGRSPSPVNAWIELTVTEGRNHLVKRMFEAIGHPVVRLRRVGFAHLTLEGLRQGRWRHLRRDELKLLQSTARAARKRREKPGDDPSA
jgi:23S rRNA pseudouridine2605 synthase